MCIRDRNKINWSAVLHAMIFFLCPRNCPATTAPPVANAENRLIINTITLSTNETPDTASSPTFAVMIESASPTVTAVSYTHLDVYKRQGERSGQYFV